MKLEPFSNIFSFFTIFSEKKELKNDNCCDWRSGMLPTGSTLSLDASPPRVSRKTQYPLVHIQLVSFFYQTTIIKSRNCPPTPLFLHIEDRIILNLIELQSAEKISLIKYYSITKNSSFITSYHLKESGALSSSRQNGILASLHLRAIESTQIHFDNSRRSTIPSVTSLVGNIFRICAELSFHLLNLLNTFIA